MGVQSVFVALNARFGLDGRERPLPDVAFSLGYDTSNPLQRPLLGDGTPQSQPIATVDSSFALFKIDRIGWQVPMHDVPAKQVKVEPLLSNGGCRQHKWPEGRVERFPYCGLAAGLRLLEAGTLVRFQVVSERKGKMRTPCDRRVAQPACIRDYVDVRSAGA